MHETLNERHEVKAGRAKGEEDTMWLALQDCVGINVYLTDLSNTGYLMQIVNKSQRAPVQQQTNFMLQRHRNM